MARPFWSNFPRASEVRASILALGCLLLAGCASGVDTTSVYERWPAEGSGATTPYLLALREYLAEPPGRQTTHRDRLRVAAETGRPTAELEYAFALSVDRDDRASLEYARDHFEKLLAAPDPLPVALDALVRLQLGQVLDRLERMKDSGEIHRKFRAADSGEKICRTMLGKRDAELEAVRAENAELREKLDALARIEQTVNDTQDNQNRRGTTSDRGENDN